ncbi:cytochrome-c peroxidase [Flavobacterium sp. UMI-01]|uniref:cytochrome-c peroxidase n=1 Tax=Flavobacterium sp. UMI-01 TaxID=1441053 RepID=UPI001C7D4C49|nr:cytochrome c peroxidase [Flavobacterium sp. UMI-01]GIZ10508.1 cytochrome-c peroxidase [Flavobacterium sp. UMI-01]
MRKFFFLFLPFFFVACTTKPKHSQVNQLFQNYIKQLSLNTKKLKETIAKDQSENEIQNQFNIAHQSYKKVEAFSEYYFPEVSKAINGPALAEFEENDNKTIPPQGFQVIEEMLFPTVYKSAKEEMLQQLDMLSSNLIRLEKIAATSEMTDAHVFDALRLEVFRIITMGITGFDSPIAQQSMPEAAVALQSVADYYQIYTDNHSDKTSDLLKKGIAYLTANPDYTTFDRAHFILQYANPISKALLQKQTELQIPTFEELRGLKTTAATLFDKNVFDPEGFSGFPDYKTTPEKIDLGKKLFHDPILSGNNSRSCASCHYEELAFTDGLPTARTMNGKHFLKRNTPTLKNIAYQRTYFADSRVSYLEDQAIAVITNEDEMHGNLDEAAQKIKENTTYRTLFQKAFPKKEINAFGIKNALASYIRSLSQYDSKFDRVMRKETTFTPEEKQGFNLFAGKAKCASCHFIPLTNGTVPPKFEKTESEVLGVPNKAGQLDDDLGKFNVTRGAIHRNSFKTPTLRNIERTAPYMHNGVFNTLEEVIEFYNKGGGVGLGLPVPNQTLPSDPLNLDEKEQKALIAFMKTLSDIK